MTESPRKVDDAHDRFGYLTVASSLHDAAVVDRITSPIRTELENAGGRLVVSPATMPREPFVVLVATGGTEAQILEVVTQRHASLPHEPVLLVTHALHNSLPAALEALARIRATGGRGRIVQVASDSTSDLRTAVADVSAIHRLRHMRLGQVGEPSPWLVASTPNASELRERWGIELVPIDIAGTIGAHEQVDPDRATRVALRFSATGAPTASLLAAAALHPVLEDAIKAAGVDALTVRCFDYLGALSTSGCVALAELNDAGIVAGCEGDVATAVAMLLVRALLDQPSWIANPAIIDADEGRILLAHCTVAPSMVNGVELHTHFESGLGIGLRGHFSPGPVTLLRLGGSALEQIWICEGEIDHAESAADLCRTQVVVRLGATAARSLLDRPLGNHLVLVHGHHRDRLERWWDLAFDPLVPSRR